MKIAVPRWLIGRLAAVFSAYHLVLATASIGVPQEKVPYVAAMAIYALVTTVSLWPSKKTRMPVWLAVTNVAAAVSMILLVSSQLPQGPASQGYTGWYTAAIGTLMVITSVRRRHALAWLGVGVLAVQTTAWQGLPALFDLGVAGSVMWVGLAHALSSSLASVGRDARHFAMAEKEAAEWRAAQEARMFERQLRLGQTGRMALPMLRRISAAGGELSDAERTWCLNLESAIRDEIRGRMLLNDSVRHEVMAARRRGTRVTLLDEGGIDDLPEADLDRVLHRLAEAIAQTVADRIVVRTVPDGESATAVTVVGLHTSDDGMSSALGSNSDDDSDGVELWLEIPRAADPAAGTQRPVIF